MAGSTKIIKQKLASASDAMSGSSGMYRSNRSGADQGGLSLEPQHVVMFAAGFVLLVVLGHLFIRTY
jgi:hypothetical protein